MTMNMTQPLLFLQLCTCIYSHLLYYHYFYVLSHFKNLMKELSLRKIISNVLILDINFLLLRRSSTRRPILFIMTQNFNVTFISHEM